MPASGFRMGMALAAAHNQRRANQGCSSGGFYKSPAASQSFTSTTPVNITWDTSCLNSSYADIYLYAPEARTPLIHAWHDVSFPTGSYQTSFQPKWWNATSIVKLQLSIVPSGTPPFQATYPAGPIFSVTYQPSSSGPNGHKRASGGKIAAGVLIPLLFVLFLVVGAYVKLKRERGKEDRKRWSEAIDSRMSTISTTWKPISVAGAQAAIRNSIAGDASTRASSFSFGNIRPASSTVAVEGGQAGIGSRARTVLPGQSNGSVHLRSSATSSQIMAERVSRISFAPDVRPSSETRRTVASRAFHTAIIPPLPDPEWEASQSPNRNSDQDETLSPTQTNGPEPLSVEDIQARLAGETTSHPSVDAVMPALRMMRTGDPSAETEGEEQPELLFSAQSATFPSIPSPAHSPQNPEPPSSMSTFMPMQPMHANVMSPDDLLRAYAERRAVGGASNVKGPSIPSPTYAGIGAQGGTRNLYSPTQPQAQAITTDRNNKRATVGTVGSQYSNFSVEDAYGGTQ